MVSLKNGVIIHSRQALQPEKTSTNLREASNLLWRNSAMTWTFSSSHSTRDTTLYQVSSWDLDQSMYTFLYQMSDISIDNGQSDESSSVLLSMPRITQVVQTTWITWIHWINESRNLLHDNTICLCNIFLYLYPINLMGTKHGLNLILIMQNILGLLLMRKGFTNLYSKQ